MLKYKTKKGEEVEIEETDVIKAVQEEYEKKLADKEKELTQAKEGFEKEKEALRQEHVKQMRAILTGRKEEKPEKEEFEEKDENEEDETLKKAKEYYKKLI